MFGIWSGTALRSALKNRLYTATNVVGLAVALTAALLIGIFIRHELTYDRMWPDVDRTYRAVADITVTGHPTEHATIVQWPFADLLATGMPDLVESVARVTRTRLTVRAGADAQSLVVAHVDPAYLDYFPGHVLSGKGEGLLARPDGMVLTESAARRLFGETGVAGRVVSVGGADVKVAAVIADRPANSHIDTDVKTDALLPFDSPFNPSRDAIDDWTSTPGQLYVRLQDGVSPATVLDRLPEQLAARRPAAVTDVETVVYGFQPVTDIHLRSERYPEGAVRGSISTVTAFTVIAGLILGIAAVNYTNLGSALAFSRAKEVGVRKVVGAGRARLILQFLGEAVFTALIALVLALAAAELLLPWFSGLMGRMLDAGAGVLDPLVIALALLLALAVGVAGAIYPAVRLTALNPVAVMKGQRVDGGVALRSVLILLQFAAAISLVVGTITVHAQMSLLRSADLGYARERVVVLPDLPAPSDSRMQTVMAALAAVPGVEQVARTMDIPTNVPERYFGIRRADGGSPVDIATFIVGAGALETLGVRPIAGRLPDPARMGDELQPMGEVPTPRAASLVLNESAVRFLGFPSAQDAVGAVLISGSPDAPVTYTVIGVIADVRFGTARDEVKATIYPASAGARTAILRIAPGAVDTAMAEIRAVWSRTLPDTPLRAIFIEDRYAALYAAEDRQAAMLAAFAGLAIFVACLGLFGLSAFTAERRTKEIGIRKVLGATVADIVQFLVWQFSKPVLLANLIAWPVAWVLMRGWLDGYVLRVELHPGYFLAAGAAALAIAWITVATHATRVARSKPVTALCYE